MKKAIVAFPFAATLFAGTPQVGENVTFEQNPQTRLVTITYSLSEAAIVTLDVLTNATDGTWASIGGEAVCNAQGDVWKKVESDTGTITWRPDLSWPDHKIENGIRAKVTAWSLDNTPDYMVVDISSAARPDTQKYYPSADFLPGGLLANQDYRVSSLVMRKIMAKDVEWTMGSAATEVGRVKAREGTHKVKLSGNYYIGVFPVTQAQHKEVLPNSTLKGYYTQESSMRPMEQISYNEIRNSATATENTAFNYPADPHSGSFLGQLREKTGIDFDLPSEAQWEFAARAGNGSGFWGDGSAILDANEDANLSRLARYRRNGGQYESDGKWNSWPAETSTEHGTAAVGNYAPNSWGIYDMGGNIWEWCLDWYEEDIATAKDADGNLYAGRVNIDPEAPSRPLNPSVASGSARVRRGGGFAYEASYCRPSFRDSAAPQTRNSVNGFRVVCKAGLD